MPIIPADIWDIGFDGIVASAGCHVEVDSRVLYDNILPENTIQECLSIFHGLGIYCRMETAEGLYADTQIEALFNTPTAALQDLELRHVKAELNSGLPLRPYAEYPRRGAYKITFIAPSIERFYAAEKLLGDQFEFVRHHFRPDSVGINGEIIRKDVGKDHGMKLICQYYNIKLEDAIAFGDSMNDASMLRCAGVSIAMGNADDRVKALADRVCESVTEDGIYWEFRRMGLCS